MSIPVASNPVIKPARTRVRVEQSAAALELRRRGMGFAGAFFLALWLIGWTVGCVFLTRQVILKRELFMILFATPFWASWIFVAGILIYTLFGFEGLRVGRDGVEWWKGIGGWRFRQKHVPLTELHLAESYTASYQSNDRPVYGLQIRTIGKPVIFGVGLPQDEREWLISLLNETLAKIGPGSHSPNHPAGAIEGVPTLNSSTPPSDSDWRMVHWPQGDQFIRRGHLNWGTLGMLLFLNLFWNGIVSVFVMGLIGAGPGHTPKGGEWWFMFFFLIPFEAVGIFFVGAMLACILTPWSCCTLTLDRSEISLAFTVWGFGRTRRCQPSGLSGLAIRRRDQSNASSSFQRGGAFWEIVLADTSRQEVMRIKSLTEGEANWIAEAFYRNYPRSLSRATH